MPRSRGTRRLPPTRYHPPVISTSYDRWRRWLFLPGLALSLLLAWRAQSGGDQLNLLTRGWLWAERGTFLPFGNPLSNGGVSPGSVTTFLVGLPLFAVRDHRAPIALVILFHVLAYLLLDRTLARILAPRERLLFAVVYWLNPWRLYLSGFLWNPNYLCLPAAAHFATAWRMRGQARFWPSFVHVVAVGIALQLHPSAILLVFASLLLLWRRSLRFDFLGAALGAAVIALSLLPWALAVDSAPGALPGEKGFLFRGLIYLFPLLRGWLYWLRYASLYLSEGALKLDFSDLLGAPLGVTVGKSLGYAVTALTTLTVALPIWANVRLFRRWRRRLGRRTTAPAARSWLRDYTLAAFFGATIGFALSPTTVMSWQAIVVLHGAAFPLVFLGAALWRRPRRAAWVRRGAVAWSAASVVLVLILAAGSRYYRCHGPELLGVGVVLRHDHAMFRDLGLSQTCPMEFDAVDGWWPDRLPEN